MKKEEMKNLFEKRRRTRALNEKLGLRSRRTYPARTLLEILREAAEGGAPSDLEMGHDPGTYTARKDGVRPEHNIRTDRYEIALDSISWAREQRVQREKEAEKERQAGEVQEVQKE